VPLWTLLLFLLGLAGTGAFPAADGEKLSYETAQALSGAAGAWIQEQTEGSKNEYGKPNKRGYFSRDFRPTSADTYIATVHIETAGTTTKTTERFEVTLKQEGGKWKAAGHELKDTYEGMHRELGVRCYPFSDFSFDREGMKLHAANGLMCENYYQGTVNAFQVYADGMRYSYEPPEHAQDVHLLQEFHSVFQSMKKDHESELAFNTDSFLFNCDPQSCEMLIEAHFQGLERQPAPQTETGTAEASAMLKARNWNPILYTEAERERRETPFIHYTTPDLPGNRHWSVFVTRKVEPFTYAGWEEGLFDFSGGLPGPGVQLVYNNWGGYEVEFSVWPRRADLPGQLFATVYGYYSAETLKTTDPYGIERREDEDARWHHVYSVKGTVDLALEDPEMLQADITFGIELKQDLREIPFFIASIEQRDWSGDNKPRVLHVNSVQLDGQELTWTRVSQLGGLIILPQEMPAGSRLDLRMNFGTKAMIKWNHSFTEVNRFGWMPFVRFGDFIDEFELTIRSPSEYKVLGIGHKLTQETKGGITTTHWNADSPVVFPSIAFGKYREDTPGDKFELPKKADGTAIPVVVHIDESSFVDWDIRGDSLRPIAQQAANAINLYTEISGLDYPYGELNFVNDPRGFLYGQAPSSLIYLGSGVFRGEGSLAPYFNDATSIAKFLKSVTAHEVGHQWWGSRVSNANGRNYWFVESLAEYFSAIYLENAHGLKEYQEQVDEWRRTILERQLKSSVQNASSIWSGEDGFGSYQAAVYNKGPYAFHMLRETFGDEKFFEFLKKFSQELAAKREIVTLDIQRAAEKALGGIDPEGNPYTVDLGWFFDQWIRGTGTPQYRFLYEVRATEDGGYLIEGVIEQRVVMGSGSSHDVLEGTYYRGVVDITVEAKGESYERRLVVEGPQTPFKLKVPKKPIEVALNKNGEMLSLDVIVNKSWD
jgi:hypothetical protein